MSPKPIISAPIFILTGAPASGKTTLAKVLLEQFAFGVHIPVDLLRGFVTSGLSNPIGSWDDETDRQFRLARDSAAQIGRVYAKDGFAVVIDDVIFPDQLSAHYDQALAGFEVYKILLRPTLATTIARNRARQIDVDNAQLEQIIAPIYNHFATFDLERLAKAGWHIRDTSGESVEASVSTLLGSVKIRSD